MDIPALRAAFVRIGFSAAAAGQITMVQAINSLTKVQLLRDDEVRALCKVICRPAGLVNNPNTNTPGQLPLIPNPGIMIPLPAELNLHTQPSDLPKINEKDMVKTFNSIDAYLRTYLGEMKIPLQYVTREHPEVTPSAADPSVNHATIDMEMITRAPHEVAPGVIHPIYVADNHKVWEIMEEIVRDSNGWTWMKSHSRCRDGREAYWSLYNHYLGASKTNNVQASAEGKLNNTIYQGEKRRFNFERYAQIHKEQHTALNGLEQHGYALWTKEQKFDCRLLASEQAN
jgi:hypothetical protein